MPNIDNAFLLLLIGIILLLLMAFVAYRLMKQQFSAKLSHLMQRESELLDERQQLKSEISDLQNKSDQLSRDKSGLDASLQAAKQRNEELKTEITQLNKNLYNADLTKNDLQISLTKAQANNDYLTKKLTEEREQLENLNKKFNDSFENLAQKILDEKSEKFTKQNQENLHHLLHPLHERLQGFEKRVETTHKESLERGAQLRQQIIGLKELNEQMSQEANNLTRALKGDSKTQGNWGEMILESVLEKSGLQKDLEYFVQQSFTTEDGKRLLPDVIIQLPGNKKMIIDSKVSLNAYETYVNTTDSEERTKYQKMHLSSVERHYQQLSQKNYQRIYELDSLDFVLMFIPIESAFALASQSSPSLYRDAFEKNIILVTPTTLLAVLRTIDTLWQNEKQKKNALDIAKQAGLLYDTFVNLLTELDKVGNQMDTAKNSYDNAMKKLKGNRNLFKNITKLKKLGAKASKHIDENLLKHVEDYNDEED